MIKALLAAAVTIGLTSYAFAQAATSGVPAAPGQGSPNKPPLGGPNFESSAAPMAHGMHDHYHYHYHHHYHYRYHHLHHAVAARREKRLSSEGRRAPEAPLAPHYRHVGPKSLRRP